MAGDVTNAQTVEQGVQPRSTWSAHARLRLLWWGCGTALLLAATAWLFGQVYTLVAAVLVPVALGVLLAGLLMPVQTLFNHRLRLPRHGAAGACLLVLLGALSWLVWVAGAQFASGVTGLRFSTADGLQRLEDMLVNSPLPVGHEQIQQALTQVQGWLTDNSGVLTQEVLRAGSTVTGFLTGAILTLVATFFMLAEGDRLWCWFVERLPAGYRRDVHEAFRRGWVTLGTYAKMQIVVAGVDAAGIGAGAWLLGLPFVLPLTAIVFVMCFIPILGALLSGVLVVVVALVTKSVSVAVTMLIIVLAVHQLEGNLLSPYLMGKAVSLHPLAVILGVTTGGFIGGLPGALFTVPFLAVANTVWHYLSGDDMFPGLIDGGSALTDSARKLSRGRQDRPVPRQIGTITPRLDAHPLVRDGARLTPPIAVVVAAEDAAAQEEADDAAERDAAHPRRVTVNAPHGVRAWLTRRG
ncbi:MAG: AI-2E family transporter [Dermatophilaceae bacterium]